MYSSLPFSLLPALVNTSILYSSLSSFLMGLHTNEMVMKEGYVSSTNLRILLSLIIISVVVVETHYVTLAGQEFTAILLVLPLECQDYGSMPLC